MGKQMEGAIRVNLIGGIHTIKQNLTADDMRQAFMSKNYAPVKEVLTDAIDRAVRGNMQLAIDGVAEATIRGTPTIPNSYRYDASNPRTKKFIAERTGELITTSEDGLQHAVKAMTRHALSRGVNYQQAANTIRNSIGLNAPQAQSLANYVKGLNEQGMPQARIDALSSAMSSRMLDYRAMMIAQNEIRDAQNQGQLDVWKQAADDDMLPPEARKVWRIDGNPCPEWCIHMDGEAVGLNEDWTVRNSKTGETRTVHTPSDVHVCCRCMMDIDMG